MTRRRIQNPRDVLWAFAMISAMLACSANAGGGRPGLIEHYLEVSAAWAGPPSDMATFEFDVTNDGRPEIFLTATKMRSKNYLTFHIYSPVGEGAYRHLGDAYFDHEEFYYDGERNELVVVAGNESRYHLQLDRYRFSDSGREFSRDEERFEWDSEIHEQFKTRARQWREANGIDVYLVPLERLQSALARGEDAARHKGMLSQETVSRSIAMFHDAVVINDKTGQF